MRWTMSLLNSERALRISAPLAQDDGYFSFVACYVCGLYVGAHSKVRGRFIEGHSGCQWPPAMCVYGRMDPLYGGGPLRATNVLPSFFHPAYGPLELLALAGGEE